MKAIAQQYQTTDELYGKPTKTLDVLLIGKYGSRKINPLMKDFTNNQGIVSSDEDLNDLAEVVVSYYKDMWDKKYEALTIDYSMLEPYHVAADESTTSESENTNTSTNSTVGTNEADTINYVEHDVTGTETRNSVDTKEDSTVENNERSQTESDNQSKIETTDHSKNDVDVTTTSYENYSEVDTRDGSRSVNSVDVVSANGEESKDTDTQNINKDAVTPYTPVSLRNKEQIKDHNTSQAEEDNDNTNVSSHNEVETYSDFTDEKTKSGDIKEETTDHDNYTDDKLTNSSGNTVSEGSEDDIQDHSATDTHSSTNVNTQSTNEEVSNNSTVTNTTTGTTTGTSSDDSKSHRDFNEHGNKWNFTNQKMISEELELRKNNFYDSILSDIAKLLTLSVYMQEDL